MKKILTSMFKIILLIVAFFILCSYCEKKAKFVQMLLGMNENPFIHFLNGFSIHTLLTDIFMRVCDIVSFIVHTF